MDETDTQATGSVAPQEDVVSQPDTADTQSSEASESVTDAPKATQEQADAQEAEAPDTKAEDTADKLLAGKYKTVEELEKAYKNAESKLGQTTSEKAELSKAINEGIVPPSADTALGYSDEASERAEALQRDMAVLKFINARSDANPATMKEILTTDPNIQQIGSYEARLEYAYNKSQNMAREKAIAEAEKKGANQAQAKIAEKKAAQVESAQKAEPTDENSELLDKLRNGTPAEKQAARETLIRKNLVNI